RIADRRPLRGRVPGFLAEREIMYGRLGGESGVHTRKMLIEETQHLGEQRDLRLDLCAPWRHVHPRPVVPWPEQQIAVSVGQGEMARDRAVGVAGAVHPAGDGIDR